MNSYSLPLFPLNVVVCPGGYMPLRLFEARYLDMVKNCLRNKSSFAIVTVLPEGETDPGDVFPFANVGTLLEIKEADVTTVGLMTIHCIGHHRVKVSAFTQQADGLFIGKVIDIADDIALAVPEDMEIISSSLKRLLDTLSIQGILPSDMPVSEPYHFDDASWVSNRWVELLNLPLIQKQRLMQLDSPIVRLELIHDILTADSSKSV